jgi:hypothetical protein
MATTPILGGLGAQQNPGAGGLNQGGSHGISGTVVPAMGTDGTMMPAPTGVVQGNPYAPPGAVPMGAQPVVAGVDGGVVTNNPATPGAIPTNTPTGVQGTGVNWVDGSNTVIGDFKDTYGSGTGTAIAGVLQNMGTVNDSAIQALIAQTNTAANMQYGNIQAQEAAGGITPNSSTAALAAGDFYSQVNQGLQTEIGQMEMGQENTLLQALMSEGAAHGGDSSFLGTLGQILGSSTGLLGSAIGSVAGSPSSSSSGSGGGMDMSQIMQAAGALG